MSPIKITGANAAVISYQYTLSEVTIELFNGWLILKPLDNNAIQVKFCPEIIISNPSKIILPSPDVLTSVQETDGDIQVILPELSAIICKKSGSVSFNDSSGHTILSEKTYGREVLKSVIQGEDCFAVTQIFNSPPDEQIFGAGQFQDGFLNIKGLPRRLTQVNTQISIPFITSNKGYSILWHNYGLTDINVPDLAISLTQSSAKNHQGKVVTVTTAEGTQEEFRKDSDFTGKFEILKKGKYAFMLDIGQKMARGYHVHIDGSPILDLSNFWLPPTTSWFLELDEGMHEVTVTGNEDDRPMLFYKLSDDDTVFHSPVADELNYIVFAGNADKAIASYRRLTGAAPMLPKWAFGYIHCRERYHSQEELIANALEFRQKGLPIDLIVQDWQYWGKYGWNAMQFDEADYPDPAGMVARLHEIDIKLMVSVWSKIDPASDVGQEFENLGLFIPGTNWVDFFNPQASSLYWERMRERMHSLGIDAWWLDATEPENDDLADRKVTSANVAGERFRLLYPFLVTKTVYEGSRTIDPEKRVFILSRSAFPGAQRFATVTWSGDVGNDWETMRRQLAGGLGYMASGMPWWTFDAGGFFRPGELQYTDKDYHERLIRWFQLATFTPLQRVHGYQSNTEFWNYGEWVTGIAHKYLNLRYRILSYIYSYAAAVTHDGYTIMRPLIMDFPLDTEALNAVDQYMFGDAFLVAPILEAGKISKTVYLPNVPFGWFDFWTGEIHKGGQTIETSVNIEEIPLFVKGGSIIPIDHPRQHTGEFCEELILRIYTGADATFTLYEDDGFSYDYERGGFATIIVEWSEENNLLTIDSRQGYFQGMQKKRVFNIVWVNEENGLGDSDPSSFMKVDYTGSRIELKKEI